MALPPFTGETMNRALFENIIQQNAETGKWITLSFSIPFRTTDRSSSKKECLAEFTPYAIYRDKECLCFKLAADFFVKD